MIDKQKVQWFLVDALILLVQTSSLNYKQNL